MSRQSHRGSRALGAGVAVAVLSFVAVLELPVASAPAGIDPTTVNRALKGNRLPGSEATLAKSVPPLRASKLPDGCAAAFSLIERAPAALEIARRCQT